MGSVVANGLAPMAEPTPPDVLATLDTTGEATRLTGRDLRGPPPGGLGMPAPSAWSVLSGNFVLHVEQTGVGRQKTVGRRKRKGSARAPIGGREEREETLTGKADRADVADVDDLLVAEAGSAKVDSLLSRQDQKLTHLSRRKERHLKG